MPEARRREVYAACREHGVLILEDDPYFYLQFEPGGGAPRGLSRLGASFLSMDVDGRVIRLDSFAKVQAMVPFQRAPCRSKTPNA